MHFSVLSLQIREDNYLGLKPDIRHKASQPKWKGCYLAFNLIHSQDSCHVYFRLSASPPRCAPAACLLYSSASRSRVSVEN